MKVLKNSLWNRIFKRRQLMKQKMEILRLEEIERNADRFVKDLMACKSLLEMLEIHKKVWLCGIRNTNIGPCKYGMFRTENIMGMQPSEVFLGDIYGLWTFPITTWEEEKGSPYGGGADAYGLRPDITIYEIVCDQYRQVLVTNIRDIKKKAEQCLKLYREYK